MNLINELRMLAEDLYVSGYNRYSSAMSRVADELERLRAKITEMEKQEPVRLVTPTAYRWRYRGAIKWQYGELTEETVMAAREHNHEVQSLYSLPGAKKWGKMNSLISRLQRPGYDLQKEQAIQEAIVMLRQCNAQSKPDCGETGHDEGRCGNRQCLPGTQTKGERNE